MFSGFRTGRAILWRQTADLALDRHQNTHDSECGFANEYLGKR